MNTKTFHENFTVDRKSKGVRATAKTAPIVEPDIPTADGGVYDPAQTYFFFDDSTKEIRQSLGFRRSGDHLSSFGLRIVEIGRLRATRDDALADGQAFFKAEIERLKVRIKDYELKKTPGKRSLKAFLMAKD